MVTLLDTHPDIAMSYELYPNLLAIEDGANLKSLASSIRNTRNAKELEKVVPTAQFRTSVIRCERSGLTFADFAALLEQLSSEGHHLSQLAGRLRMIELCALTKMKRANKKRWGMKCNSAYGDYLSAWPKAQFLNMLRDGRDVLSSQLNTGSFRNSPAEVADGWQKTHRQFQGLVERDDTSARIVRYEKLTHDPETELRDICAFLNVPFAVAMLEHTKADLTIFQVNHLSGKRLAKSIDTSSIGRWKQDLSPDQLKEFLDVAEGSLKEFGYI